MQFDDPIAAGVTLVRVALQSADFETGVAGWRIARNGDVEFNDAVIRGVFRTLGPNGGYVLIDSAEFGSYIGLMPSPESGTASDYFIQGFVGAQGSNVSGDEFASLVLRSPYVRQGIVDYGASTLSLYGGFPGGFGPYAVLDSPLYINGNDIGQGVMCPPGSSGTNSGAIGATETVVLTTGTGNFQAGRAYRFTVEGGFACSVANSRPLWQVRKGNSITGTFLGLNSGTVSGGVSANTQLTMSGVFTCSADVSTTICLTLQGSAGFTATMTGGNGGRTLTITDIGLADNYPDAKVLS